MICGNAQNIEEVLRMIKRVKRIASCAIVAAMIMVMFITGTGFIAATKTGTWKHNNKGYWYQYSDGSYAVNEWLQDGSKWYHFSTNGYMQTGWQAIGGKWYFFAANGAMQTGWKAIGGKWYFLNSNGTMQTGWKAVGGKWYYFNASGVMQTDWQKIGGKWYYFNASGEMLKNQYVGSYYVGADGAMTTPPATKVSDTAVMDFVLNTNTLKIHLPSCSSVTEMNPKNKQGYHGTIAELKKNNYSRCNRCLSEH